MQKELAGIVPAKLAWSYNSMIAAYVVVQLLSLVQFFFLCVFFYVNT